MTLLLAVFTLLSRLVGFVRDLILASTFGADKQLDTYNAAFSVPDFMFNFFIFGTLTVAFLPIFNRDLIYDKVRAKEFASVVYTLSVLAISVLSLIVFIFTPALIRFLFPAFGGQQIDLTIIMTRVMLFSPVLFTASNIAAILLQSNNKFLPTAISPIFYNLGIIAGAVLFSKYFGVVGLAFGVILGALMHAFINILPLRRLAWQIRVSFNFKMAELKELWRLYLPRLFAFDTFYISLIISILVAQFLAEGSITVFKFASNLEAVPIGIFALSFAVAAFPSLSQAWAAKHIEDFKGIIRHSSIQILFFIIPLSALMFVLRAQIVRLVYGHGKWGWDETFLTAQTLGFLVISLFAQGLLPLFAESFYATHNTVIPVAVSIITALVNIVLAIVLAEAYGVVGLAAAASISAVVSFSLLFIFLRLRIGRLGGLVIAERVLKILIATGIAAIGAYATLYAVAPVVGTSTSVGVFIQALLASLVGLILYMIAALLLALPEARAAVSRTAGFVARITRPLNEIISYVERL